MQNVELTLQQRILQLDDDMKRLQLQLALFDEILSHNDITLHLDDFDARVNQEIAEIFGSSSEMLEAYARAKHDETAGWMNLPEVAREYSWKDREAMSFKQRARVLERCIANLMARRSILLNLKHL